MLHSRLGDSIPVMRFVALDSWRGISALMVALFHLKAYGHFYDLSVVRNSDLQVDFFFVLSGFVISYSSFPRLTRLRDLLPFMIRRFGRVWPLHAVMLAAFIIFPLSELLGCYMTKFCGTEWPFNPETENARSVLSSLLLVHSLGLHHYLPWNWPSSSISTEFYTYALFALVATVLTRGVIVPFSIIMVFGCAAVLLLVSPRHMQATYDFGYFRCVLGFFTGFLIFRLYAIKKLALADWVRCLKWPQWFWCWRSCRWSAARAPLSSLH